MAGDRQPGSGNQPDRQHTDSSSAIHQGASVYLGDTVREECDERVEEALGVEKTNGLGMEAKLLPRQHLTRGGEAPSLRDT